MSQYLVFQLHGPMASWGVDAPGEVRHSHELPSRSALLGFLAAALGIRRDEEARLNAFNQHYSFLLCASQEPRWARDYHTVQMPKEVRKARYFCRREELSDPELLSALISRRDYYTDAWWMVALTQTTDAPYSLEQLRDALQHPVFPLYLGRKSCPPALPLAPLILDGTLAHVFYQAEQALICPELAAITTASDLCYWEGEPQGVVPAISVQRSDQPLSKVRWQFTTRTQFAGQLREEK